MAVAGGHRHPPGETAHARRDGVRVVVTRTVAELAVAVASPRPKAPVRLDGQGMHVSMYLNSMRASELEIQ